jgi:hypothetical protein
MRLNPLLPPNSRRSFRFRLVTQGSARSSLALGYYHSAPAGAPEVGGS